VWDEAAQLQRDATAKKSLHIIMDALAARSQQHNAGGGLLLLTAQPPLAPAVTLREKQYRCATSNTTVPWSAGDQRRLNDAAKIANVGAVSFATFE
jgi:hypothetical protein